MFWPASCHFAVKCDCGIQIALHFELDGGSNCVFGIGVFGRWSYDNLGLRTYDQPEYGPDRAEKYDEQQYEVAGITTLLGVSNCPCGRSDMKNRGCCKDYWDRE